MADLNSLELTLKELKRPGDVIEATLVSRSGMHIAGEVPKTAHMETFVAMNAIIMGAAESITSEIKEDLENVVVNLKDSKILITDAGPKAVLVLRVKKDAPLKAVFHDIEKNMERISRSLA